MIEYNYKTCCFSNTIAKTVNFTINQIFKTIICAHLQKKVTKLFGNDKYRHQTKKCYINLEYLQLELHFKSVITNQNKMINFSIALNRKFTFI